jgi:hypothetical protein
MPPVFDGATKIPRRVKEPMTDKKLPAGMGLNYGSITGESALGGTKGVDCKKLTGNRWEEVQGDLTQNYVGDKKIDVKGKHTEKVMGDHKLTVSTGNAEFTVGAGKLTEKVAQNHEETVGLAYKLKSTMQEFSAAVKSETKSALVDIKGVLVKINS